MNQYINKVDAFLKKEKLHQESIDSSNYVNKFIQEMEKGLTTEGSSLPMIPTYIEADAEIPRNRKVLAMDAGGTNLRAALISFDDEGKPVIEEYRKGTMPGSKEILGKEAFFDAFATFITDIADQAETIGFCFSYPAEILPNKDGRIMAFTKEIKAPEVEGQVIGENLLEALKRTGNRGDQKVILLNDTVADLLAGRALNSSQPFSTFVGFILGTGINGCYIEENKNILKTEGLDASGSQIINIEAGFYSKMDRSDIDIKMDEKTEKPGTQPQEKMISGAYFGAVCREAAQKAAQEGLFSDKLNKAVIASDKWTTADVDKFLHNPGNSSNKIYQMMGSDDTDDRHLMYFFLNAILDRTAKLTAALLGAIILKSGKGLSPLMPACLAIDGTTYHRFFDFNRRVEVFLQEILKKAGGRYYKMVIVEDAPLIGAAAAALIN